MANKNIFIGKKIIVFTDNFAYKGIMQQGWIDGTWVLSDAYISYPVANNKLPWEFFADECFIMADAVRSVIYAND